MKKAKSAALEVRPPIAKKPGTRTGKRCPACGDEVLQQDQMSASGAQGGARLVCSKRGCPWQGRVR